MTSSGRYWQIDAARGAAILLMVVFHLVVDLSDFFAYELNYLSGPWFVVGRASAVLFMLIAGVSASLARNHLSHGIRVFGWGMVITAATFLFTPAVYVRFGILHFLGFSIASFTLLRRADWPVLSLLSLAAFGLGFHFSGLTASSPLLLPLGIMYDGFRSMDYYPVFPWYGVFLAGAAAAKGLTLGRARPAKPPAVMTPLAAAGRHSLVIYLLHQPVLLAGLWIARALGAA